MNVTTRDAIRAYVRLKFQLIHTVIHCLLNTFNVTTREPIPTLAPPLLHQKAIAQFPVLQETDLMIYVGTIQNRIIDHTKVDLIPALRLKLY